MLQTPLSRRDMLRHAVSGLAATAFPSQTGRSSPPEALTREAPHHHWAIRSVDMQKETQDKLRDPASEPYIKEIVKLAKEVNATHVAIGTPYDNPADPQAVDTIEFTRQWADAAHDIGLNVWFRQMPEGFQGFYNEKKEVKDYKPMIVQYILDHSDFYRDGDIFAPFPEPQNGGVVGINCQPSDTCQFKSVDEFNQEMQAYVAVCRKAFAQIGKKVNVGYYGFDGFVVAGLGNPDWEGKTFLSDETVKVLDDTITVDHYTDKGPQGYVKDYTTIHNIFPKDQIVIGELGPASSLPDNASQEEVTKSFHDTLDALSKLDWIIAVNMYPFISGKPQESLILVDNDKVAQINAATKQGKQVNYADAFIRTPQYEVVKEYFERMAV
jgi:hypothetical protein